MSNLWILISIIPFFGDEIPAIIKIGLLEKVLNILSVQFQVYQTKSGMV